MADVKISALPLATTPLSGTEVLPIVQSATTDQVTVANLTAGRAVSASSLTLTSTPLAVGSGGTGITSLGAGVVTALGNAVNGASGIVVEDSNSNVSIAGTLSMGSSFKRNRLINGNVEVWQRGTSFSPAGSVIYGVDRFWLYSTYAVYTRQSYGTTDFNYCARVQRPASNTSTGNSYFQQIIESVNCQGLAGGNATFSFYARRGADYSSTSNLLTTSIFFGSGTDQGVAVLTGAGWTNQTNPTSTVTLTTSWQRFSVTVAVPANTNEISVGFLYVPVGTALTNDYFEVAGLQFEPGSIATPYERQIYSEQLAQCQRYLPAFSGNGTGDNYPYFAVAGSTTQGYVGIPFLVQARVPPTGLVSSTASGFSLGNGVANTTCTALAFSSGGVSGGSILATVASGLTQYYPYLMVIGASSTFYFTGCEL